MRRIRMELRLKGVNQQEIDHALSELDDDELLQSAYKAAQKFARGKDISSPGDRQKILAALARRGFDFSLARQVLHMLMEAQ